MLEKLKQFAKGLAYGLCGGVVGLFLLALVSNNPEKYGNVADWFGALGTILAIAASVWITRYQVKNDRDLAKKNFFDQQEFIMLDSVSKYISDIESARRIIGSILNDTNTSFDKENSLPRIESNIDLIEKYVYVINFRLYEYGRTKEGYTYINMEVMRPLLGSFSNLKQDFYKVKKDSSNNYEALKDSELKFASSMGLLEYAILEKKTEIRSLSA